MKKSGVLNRALSKVIASMGHTDRLVICDSGLPIPKNAEIVDLALTGNIPRFVDTLKVILEELQVENAIVAEEILKVNNGIYKEITSQLKGIDIKKVSHEKFKELTRENGNIYFVRTGEVTPYANIILVSGVTFD
jgi:D-ribose pyranase